MKKNDSHRHARQATRKERQAYADSRLDLPISGATDGSRARGARVDARDGNASSDCHPHAPRLLASSAACRQTIEALSNTHHELSNAPPSQGWLRSLWKMGGLSGRSLVHSNHLQRAPRL